MAWFHNLRIKRKLIVSFSAVLVLVLGLSVFSVTQILTVDTTYNTVIENVIAGRAAILNYQSNFRDLRRIIATMSTYTGYDDDKCEELYKQAKDVYDLSLTYIDAYDKAVRENPDYEEADINSRIANSAELRRISQYYLDEFMTPMYNAAKDGNHDESLEVIAQAGDIAQQIRDKVAEMLDAANKATSDNSAAATAMALRTMYLVIALSIIIIGLSLVLALAVSGMVAKPINRLVEVAHNVAKGNLNVNIDTTYHDEIGMLATSFSEVVGIINTLIVDLRDVAQRFSVEGDIDASVDNAKYEGSYKEVVDNINSVVSGMIKDILMFFECMNSMSNGDFSADIPKLPGKKQVMNKTLDDFKAAIQSVNHNINKLVKHAADGELSRRADTSAYKGDWNALIGGLNKLMDAVSQPVAEISDVMESVSRGNFETQMSGDYKGDFQKLKLSINTTVTNVASYINEIASVLTQLSNNHLDLEVNREYVGSFGAIKDALNNIIDTFNSVIGDIASASEQVAAGARAISESSMLLAQGATEQASSIEELNATIITINESTERNAGNAANAETLSNNSKSNANRGDDDMKDMLVAMDEIKNSSNKISKIIKVIEDIAFQTNLLALNAAVEAARAGEHGKGFAVVAEEVRTLASRSQTAAKETSELIEESINRVEEGTKIADKTAEALRVIVGDIGKISDIIADISHASADQAEAVGQITQGMVQITDVVQNNSATSEEEASASEELSSQSEVMKNLVSVFTMKKSKRY